ncbi:MAG: transglycosylase SLT domain-containing protein [Rhodanobacteraceae bacterium]
MPRKRSSRWKPDANATAGARGIMMLTRPTARAVHAPSRLSAEQSITGGAKYMRRIEQELPAAVKPPDRHYLALAAYNIGYVHLADAMQLTKRLGRNPDLWTEVEKTLPLLTERRYYDTLKQGYAPGIRAVRYVHRIRGDADIIRHVVAASRRSERRAG